VCLLGEWDSGFQEEGEIRQSQKKEGRQGMKGRRRGRKKRRQGLKTREEDTKARRL
jgi:hypothetical protein